MELPSLRFAGVVVAASVGRIAVAAMQPVVAEIFDIARFGHVVEVFPSVRAALQSLAAPALAAYEAAVR